MKETSYVDADLEIKKRMPWLVAGLIISVLLLVYMCVGAHRRQWLIKQYQEGHSWILLLVGYILVLFAGGVACGLDSKRVLPQYKVIEVQSPLARRIIQKVRGQNYSLDWRASRRNPAEFGKRQESLSRTLVTAWSASHFLTYLGLGFVAPKLWAESMAIGVAWEVFEANQQCHDWLDIVWNGLGLAAGVLVRNTIDPPFDTPASDAI